MHTARHSARLTLTQSWAVVKGTRPVGVHPRIIFTEAGSRSIHIPPVLLPPVVFTGLLIGLWIWYVLALVFSFTCNAFGALDTFWGVVWLTPLVGNV